MQAFDPEILNDFLTESGELLEELDADLVVLESTPTDPDLLNKVFRALHTIKGSASFLALDNLVKMAHAAEDALNTARRGDIVIDRAIMDLLLEAVDVLKKQFVELEANEPLTEPNEDLVKQLRAIGEGKSPTGASQAEAPASTSTAAAEPEASATAELAAETSNASGTGVWGAGSHPLDLGESKVGLLDFMIADLDESLDEVEMRLTRLVNGASEDIDEDTLHVAEMCDALSRTADFFEFEQMKTLVGMLGTGVERIGALDDDTLAQLFPRLEGILALLRQQSAALCESNVLWWSIDTLAGSIADLILEHDLDDAQLLPTGAGSQDALVIDGVVEESQEVSTAQDEASTPEAAANASAAAPDTTADRSKADPAAGSTPPSRAKIEQTIRVEVGRLESLLNLVGELVLQKNRIGALSRQVVDHAELSTEAREAFSQSSDDLDRVTGEIQMAVMRTRMQPLDKLFGKYPRLIRDLSHKTNKKIALEIIGGETEVDKSVIEELGDPLVHLLRNSADHAIGLPDERLADGKPETGTIRLIASQAGDHVLVQIVDDGNGLDRKVLIAKGIEKGMTTAADAEALSDRDVYRFIFGAGFSTAKKVSDLSGRGVGMDVVRTNIEKLKGTVDVDSTPGQSTTISIRIPLTVAIMPAMMVGVGTEFYAVPLSNIVEIVRPEEDHYSSINGKRVLKLRDGVLPIVSMADLFNTPADRREEAKFAVVIELNEQRAGLMVSRLIGQYEVVIKPLDNEYAGDAPISGATVRDDGGVSLIVDVAGVIAAARESNEALAV